MYYFFSLFVFFTFSSFLQANDYTDFRLVTRKNISHILIESYGENTYLTILASSPGVHAFKSTPHHLKYFCESSRACLKELRQLNKYLIEGKEIGLYLSGTSIREFVYYPL